MKKFFKTTFACVLGTLIAGLILMILFVVMMVGAAATTASSDKPYITQENTVLHINLNGALQERYEEAGFDPMAIINQTGDNSGFGLDQIRRALEVAANDKNVEGIYIDARNLSAMPASTEEIRDMLVEFKEKSGKWIYSYADSYTQNDYFLASVADTVALN
ncbi:MAG: signal peptide peptidase SppA, partial [Muribaculaceae bacterium]|nr:signal peptide peptidase SppA [Muribaculaceae bacterium]